MSEIGTPKISNRRKWLIVLTLSLGAGLIYQLPYLRLTYYGPLQKALGLDHTSFGNLMSVYGFVAMFLYWPGGWIADRFSSRKLLTFSLVATSLGGGGFQPSLLTPYAYLFMHYGGSHQSLLFGQHW